MPDSFTESSSQSIFGRLGDAIKGVLVGLILIPVAIILLFWNEGRAVKTATSLKQGASAVVSITPDSVQAANEGKLVHISGEATTGDLVADARFGVSQNAIRLTRAVEMFQWQEEKKSETQKKLGGGTETQTTYNYTKKWSAKPIRSSEFKHPEDHQNPNSMIGEPLATVASHVTLGQFTLPPAIIALMHGDQPVALTEADVAKLPDDLKARTKCAGDAFYLGADPATPAIGDQQVTFTVLKPATFSILARQTGQTLDAFPTQAGREIERVESGNVSAAAMFQHAKSENSALTWVIRVGGTLLMALGLGLILSPLATVADVLPLLGDLVGMGVSVAALLLAVMISAVVIAVAWFAVRPLLSLALVAAVLGVWFAVKRRTSKPRLAQA